MVGDCECELRMGIGLRHSPLSSEALIRSIVVTPIYTEGPRVLHEAVLNGGVAWRAVSRDSVDGRRRSGGMLMS
jgi:hypothetical protein